MKTTFIQQICSGVLNSEKVTLIHVCIWLSTQYTHKRLLPKQVYKANVLIKEFCSFVGTNTRLLRVLSRGEFRNLLELLDTGIF